MTLTPLLQATLAIQIHVIAASVAFILGAAQLALPKGGGRHRAMGWIWSAAMATLAISSFWIHEIKLWGSWSPIHLLSILTLVGLPAALYAARQRRFRAHKRGMLALFVFALLTAGLFTLLPGRLMHQTLFGG
ncbi:MAG: DUF2306 domain-containing protein [Neomegalonema sp.]|nr:DUF2306 domain-containing protein [Neomegalonema sp.]